VLVVLNIYNLEKDTSTDIGVISFEFFSKAVHLKKNHE